MNTCEDSLPPSGRTLQTTFESLVQVLDERGVRYAIIGGLATIQHTRVRTTNDIDVLLSVPQLAMFSPSPRYSGERAGRGAGCARIPVAQFANHSPLSLTPLPAV